MPMNELWTREIPPMNLKAMLDAYERQIIESAGIRTVVEIEARQNRASDEMLLCLHRKSPARPRASYQPRPNPSPFVGVSRE